MRGAPEQCKGKYVLILAGRVSPDVPYEHLIEIDRPINQNRIGGVTPQAWADEPVNGWHLHDNVLHVVGWARKEVAGTGRGHAHTWVDLYFPFDKFEIMQVIKPEGAADEPGEE